jgi:hypothetical protein
MRPVRRRLGVCLVFVVQLMAFVVASFLRGGRVAADDCDPWFDVEAPEGFRVGKPIRFHADRRNLAGQPSWGQWPEPWAGGDGWDFEVVHSEPGDKGVSMWALTDCGDYRYADVSYNIPDTSEPPDDPPPPGCSGDDCC